MAAEDGGDAEDMRGERGRNNEMKSWVEYGWRIVGVMKRGMGLMEGGSGKRDSWSWIV